VSNLRVQDHGLPMHVAALAILEGVVSPFDRSRPLWEMRLLTGLADGTVGMLFRLHHVVADGTAALALIGTLFEAAPDAPAPVARSWVPQPPPGVRELLADNLGVMPLP
jgi:diacylglycerol O-acyltransferase